MTLSTFENRLRAGLV